MKRSFIRFKNILLLAFVLPTVLLMPFNGSAAFGKTKCGPIRQGAAQCTSEVNLATIQIMAYEAQRREQWCWAAAISMLFSYHKHPVKQDRILTLLYGTTINLPSGPGWNFASRLNADWLDDNNQRFTSRITAAYDFDLGISNLTNEWLINELDNDRPFIIGTNGHAVVATSIGYLRTPNGPTRLAVRVFDPWPGRGLRKLSAIEITPGTLRFVATVTVS